MAKKERSPEAFAARPYTRRAEPFVCHVEAGEHWWCACGKSEQQPFCDGSHRGGPSAPVIVTLDEPGTHSWCGCKATSTPPYCDGSHACQPGSRGVETDRAQNAERAGKPAMLTVEEARERVMRAVTPLGAEEVALVDAHGRVLAEQVVAPADIPAADNTAMDGYAVRAADVAGATRETPVTLDVIETLPAGYVPSRTVGAGQATRIMTGATIPDGADAIVIVEVTETDGDRVRVFRDARPGAHIRRRGEDVRTGQMLFLPGAAIGAGEIGLLASIRKGRVTVACRPVVAVVSTGDELVDVDTAPGPGQIVNSNAYSLAALVREAGGEPRVLPIARDTLGDITAALESAASSDIVITSGGVSVGEFDYVKAALDALGAELDFWRVSMKPGKPVVFAKLGATPFFGLPGNPVSCMVGFHLFVWPALKKMMGCPAHRWMRPTVTAVLTNDVRSTGDRRNYQRAVITAHGDRIEATTKPAQGSGVLSSMTGANGLVVVPQGTTRIEAGSTVEVQLIGEIVATAIEG